MIAGAIDFVVFISRDRRSGRRRVRTILEVNGYDEQIGVSASEVFSTGADGDAVRNIDVAVQRADDLVEVGWDDGVGGWR
jgi:Flp pilus assembly CpaF family ATPase